MGFRVQRKASPRVTSHPPKVPYTLQIYTLFNHVSTSIIPHQPRVRGFFSHILGPGRLLHERNNIGERHIRKACVELRRLLPLIYWFSPVRDASPRSNGAARPSLRIRTPPSYLLLFEEVGACAQPGVHHTLDLVLQLQNVGQQGVQVADHQT